jgi:drug/metabolite transporter (DMT)-like permease
MNTNYTAVTDRWARMPANTRGAALVLLGAAQLICMAALVKYLGRTLPVMEILFVRCFAGFVFMLPLLARMGSSLFRTQRPVLHFLRGTVGTVGNVCLFYAVTHMAIADAVAIQFSRPLFMIVVAALFLGEIAGVRRSVITVIGFTGILLITRPFGDGFEPVALVAAAGALTSTLVALCVKMLSRTEKTPTIMFYFSIWTTVLSFVPAMFVWVSPSATELALLVLTGMIGITGQSCFTHGLATGETTFVLPFDYLRIVFSLIIGVVIFAELPDAWSIGGIAVIVASSLYLVRTDIQAKKDRTRKKKSETV